MKPAIEESKGEPAKSAGPTIESKRVEGPPPESKVSEFEIGDKEYGSLGSQKEESTEVESVGA